jgi:hypothetical protein
MKKILNPWIIGGTVVTASLLLVVAFFASGGLTPGEEEPYQGGAEIMVIPLPTATPTLPPTMTPIILPTSTPQTSDGVQVGGYVRISGTEGEGLRLRVEPSLVADIVYLGLEGEIFLVREGPVDADGYIWWELEAPLNESRRGWAVSNFLDFVQSP